MDVAKLPSRGPRTAEAADNEIDRFIEKRAKVFSDEAKERQEEELWAESVRVHNAAREAELRASWREYHQEQAARHRAVLEALVVHHEQRAEQLMGGGDAA